MTKCREWFRGMLHGERALRLIVIIGMAGLLLLLLSEMMGDDDSSAEKNAPAMAPDAAAAGTDTMSDTAGYAEDVAKQLEDTLSHMDGVGQCRVMLTVKGSTAYAYAEDVQQSFSGDEQTYQRSCVIRNVSGDGQPLVEQVVYPTVSGVLIVCEGGGNHVVQEQVYGAVQAVLGIPSHQICVAKMKGVS